MKFSEFISLEEYIIPGLYSYDVFWKQDSLLLEYNVDELISITDKARLDRAKREVRTNPPKVYTLGDGSEKLVFNFKSFPSKSKKRIKGYVIHDEGDIKQMYCSCPDFFYKIWYVAVKMGISTYDIPPEYPRFKNHNHKPPVVTNPSEKIFLCKHLAAVRDYI